MVVKPYSLMFVQEVITGISARDLPPDLRSSGYGEWTFISLIN